MLKKLVKIAIKTLAILVVVVIVGVLGIMVAEQIIYHDYFGNDSQKEFDTPGMNDGFIQQGVWAVLGNTFLSSGYMMDKSPSRIYVTTGDSFKERNTLFVNLKDTKGNYTSNHAGGVACFGDWVYLCNSSKSPSTILVYDLSQILSAKNGDDVVAINEFAVHARASFCTIDSNVLYVGEFFKEESYPTAQAHHLTTPSGDKNSAMLYGYQIDPNSKNGGLKSNMPVSAFSITDMVQGVCFDDKGQVYLTTSFYWYESSQIFVYNKPSTTQHKLKVGGVDVPLYYLDNSNLDRQIKAPSLMEQICYKDGRFFAIFESANNDARFGKLLKARYIWSVKL